MNEIKETMTDFRARMNLSRRELATLAGVTQSQVWRMEHDYPVFTLTQASVADNGVAVLWVKIWDALQAFESENPEGKPKAVKQTTNNTKHAHIQDLEELRLAVNIAISVAKSKKTSTISLVAMLTRIDEMIAAV